MAYVNTIPVSEASGETRAMYEQAQAQVGYVPNYTKLFSLHPQVNATWGALLASVRSRMDTRRYELVTLAAARGLRSSYCMLAHGSILREKFFAPEQLEQIVMRRPLKKSPQRFPTAAPVRLELRLPV